MPRSDASRRISSAAAAVVVASDSASCGLAFAIRSSAASAARVLSRGARPTKRTMGPRVSSTGRSGRSGLWRQNADGTLTLANSYTYSSWGTPTTTTHNGYADLGFRFL